MSYNLDMTSQQNTYTAADIQKHFPELVSEVKGPADAAFSTVSSLDHIEAHSLVFLLDKKYLASTLQSQATVVLAPTPLAEAIDSTSEAQCWLLSPNPELLMAFCKSQFLLPTPYRSHFEGVHASAVVDDTAILDKTVTIGAHAVIGKHVTLANNVFIGANAVIEEGTTIGANSTIHPLAYIGHHTVIGEKCEVLSNSVIGSEGYGYAHDHKWNHYRVPHSGRVVLEDDVHVGANTSIDRGSIEDSIIKRGTKIDNQCHLAHNSVVGENSLITAQFGMAGSSSIGKNFVTGGKTSVTGHIKITDNVQIAGMSGVTKSIEEPGKYGGFPLQPLQQYLKTKAAMASLSDLRKQVKQLLKKD